MDGHVASAAWIVSVCEELRHEVFECEASLLEDSRFSILCKYDILRTQGGRGTNGDAFFSGRNLAWW